jgi:hypothetical protein
VYLFFWISFGRTWLHSGVWSLPTQHMHVRITGVLFLNAPSRALGTSDSVSSFEF